jgi:CheY-like chemotaxis protein
LARKILLADDSVTAQNMGRKILADAGYDVITVNNGSAALKRITEVKPDLIVLDVYMPGYSGLEVCQRLKESAETSHIPVLLTVGKLEPFKPEEARRAKADAHIVKPFEASELLTAITRLEDRVVPQQAESNTDLDTGWKSRLRFPSKKKKEEPEPERDDFAVAPTFRDFRKGKAKTEAREAFVAPAPEPEPAIVPDIPRDITPEELDALSALAAKLDGPASVEDTAPLEERTDPVEVPAAAEVAAATAEVETPAPVAEAKTEEAEEQKEEVETPVPPAVETVEMAAVVEAPALTVEAKSEVESPVEHVEPASEVAAVVADPAAVVAVTVNAAPLAQEPAPVDRDDEPRFASAATEVEPATEDKTEEKTEDRTEDKIEEKIKIEEKPAEALQAEMPVPPVLVAETAQEPTAEELTPSDAELAEALRLLTPATAHADVSAVPSPETLVAAGQLLVEEAARNAAAGPRWVAEPVALSSEEAAISLEAEMFRTFAAKPAAAPVEEIEPERISGVQAIAAAVESRLAEAGITAATGVPEQEAERGSAEPGSAKTGSAEHGSETAAVETSVAEAPAEVMAAVSNAEIPSEAAIEPGTEKESKAEKTEAERRNPAENVAEEEPTGATFANAVDWEKIETAAEQKEEPAAEAAAAVAEENQDSSSEDGGQESMSTDGKAKGKSNWRQIHTAPANAAAKTDVVEAAKQAQAEEAPKVMAAAAAEGSATDASSIASIVDSVLADLRPKIVEEIAKKLAGK